MQLRYVKYFFLSSVHLDAFEEEGHTLVKPCQCATSLPITHTRTLHYRPVTVPTPGFQIPYRPFWIRIQNTRKYCRLVRRAGPQHKFDHVKSTVISTYFIKDVEISRALHLSNSLWEECVCPTLYDSQYSEETIQAPCILSFSCTRAATAPHRPEQ